MKKFILVAGLLSLLAPFATAQTSTWKSDQAHSGVDFSIRHMSISNVHGHFGKVDATILYNEKDITKSSVTATIDVSTINTGDSSRDTHVKSADFFDVSNYATATFTSTSVAKSGAGLSIVGNFTLHGVTKPITLTVNGPNGPIEGMDHKPHAGFNATTTISRTAFNIGNKFPSAVVGDDVNLTIELEVIKQ